MRPTLPFFFMVACKTVCELHHTRRDVNGRMIKISPRTTRLVKNGEPSQRAYALRWIRRAPNQSGTAVD